MLSNLNVEQTAAAMEAAGLLADEAVRLGGELLEEVLWVELTRRLLTRSANPAADARKLTALGAAVDSAMAGCSLH